ncbi:hypothetical protein [Dickeya solani]|uniref:Lipoprotein n=1 Tax=Dickeya solani TaxID=1089444 RepID=A0ABU4EIA2_9GAMM|nr:hypothetical protein [Dickeya solani]MCA6999482.1 hypothetical protein [Dickeya solani]MCZ0823822.1 hypothetical protein [Dickeya solani]MDV6996212.1 hypothetical protein [Dickeya solani]MDV7005393.1 hypothetical protein [Dickeya solani]MDV7037567.1 hypothetical protein [Dickeya solani]
MKTLRMSFLSLALLSVTFVAGCAKSIEKTPDYQRRPGWNALHILVKDDCETAKSGGKALIQWKGECSVKPLIDVINKNPEKIPEFYALYHQYGAPGVLSIDVSNNSKMNYLNYMNSVSMSLNTVEIQKIYSDYRNDYRAVGLREVSKDEFTQSLTAFSKRSPEFVGLMNQEAKRLHDESVEAERGNSDQKLGVDYKAKCGPFFIDLTPHDGWARINGAKPETQKITPLPGNVDGNNVKMQWMVPTGAPGKWYGMDYVKKNGKAILNVQIVQASMNAPRVYGTYDCMKIN